MRIALLPITKILQFMILQQNRLTREASVRGPVSHTIEINLGLWSVDSRVTREVLSFSPMIKLLMLKIPLL